MTRSTPDPVFAEAGRAALLDKARAEQRSRSTTPSRRRVIAIREVLIGAAVVAAAATVLVIVHATPRPNSTPAGEPSTNVSSSATPTTEPSPSATGHLIGPTGSRVRTEAEIRTWAATVHLSATTTAQDVIVTRCMAAKGFLYDPIRQHAGDLRAGHSGMTPTNEARWNLAYRGTATPGNYTWQTAGCAGQAVHETGQDNSN